MGDGAAAQGAPPDTRSLIIWRGSQYSIKAIAALALKGLWADTHYRLLSVPLAIRDRSKLLPPPHTVPVLLWDGDVVLGTDHICAFLDNAIPCDAKLYPNITDQVGAIEKRCGELYWYNSWLSTVDPKGFDRYTGAFIRREAPKRSRIAGCLIAMAPGFATNLIRRLVFLPGILEVLNRRGGAVGQRLARTSARDAPVVLQEARAELATLNELLAASPTPWFCGAASPTAADLTLYGMLERWLGDSWMPKRHGPAQPDILDGMPAIRAAWQECRKLFMPRCNLDELSEETYVDITHSVGHATFPPAAASAEHSRAAPALDP